MNPRKPSDEENVERLIQASIDPAARPSAAAREQAWQRVHAAWQANRQADAPAEASAHVATPVQRNAQSESRNNNQPERNILMKLFSRTQWGWGFGAAAAAAAVMLLVVLTPRGAQATAVRVMTRGAQAIAKLTSVHLQGQLRTLPGDNFSYISAEQEFYPIELWKQLAPDLKWRVEKPGRVAVMDGQTTLLYMKGGQSAYKLNQPSPAAFDTHWLHTIANLSQTISNELRLAQAHGWKLESVAQTGSDGRAKAIVTVHARSGIPDDDYSKNSFLEDADTRRVYQFDDATELLERVQIFLVKGGVETQIFDLSHIDYNQPIAESTWHLDLPADVAYYQEPQVLPDNERYAAMTAEEAARTFFEACGREDWTEVGKFQSPLTKQFKASAGGLQLVSLGQAFTSQTYSGKFVPYEVHLRPHAFYVRVANTNAAKRFVVTGFYDLQMKQGQDFQWSGEPELLPNNDTYAKLTPAQAVQAYFSAQDKFDWVEMRKFASQHDVETSRSQVEAAQKKGIDLRKVMPVFQAGEAVPAPEPGVYFVKCTQMGVKKHNLALRKDNAAGRWQVDGGF